MQNKLKSLVLLIVAGSIIFLGGVYIGVRKDNETPLPPFEKWSKEMTGGRVCINFSGLSSTTAAQKFNERKGTDWYSHCDLLLDVPFAMNTLRGTPTH